MTIYNGYISRAELLRELSSSGEAQTPDVLDDEVLDNIITDASRAVDAYCARQFYASAETLYLDVPNPYERMLYFPRDVLAVQAASNGDGTLIAASNYYLWPRVGQSYSAIVLKESSTVSWAAASSGDTEGVIAIAASAGYVSRAASAASDSGEGLRVIAATRRACLVIAGAMYRKRFGMQVEAAQVTAGGVVLTPQGIPRDAAQLLEGYRRIV